MVRLITFEGGDGTGKTTQIRALESYFHELARSCIVTREPGDTALGALIRKALLEVGKHEIASSTELFLYLADRAQHVNEIILPAIHAGTIVLCDRFTDSTLAYQGYGRAIDLFCLIVRWRSVWHASRGGERMELRAIPKPTASSEKRWSSMRESARDFSKWRRPSLNDFASSTHPNRLKKSR
jgi:dTMP kinase